MQSTSATFFISQTLSKIVWSQNSPFLAGGTCDGQENYVKIWQCSFDDSQSTFDDPFVVGSSPIQGEVTDLKWVYFDNEDIFLCSTSDGQVLFFKPDPEQDNMLVDLGRSQIINSPISCFDVSLENPQIACGGENGQLLIFNLNLSNPRLTKKCDIGSGVCLNGVKFLSSNLVVAGNSRLQFWDTRTHQSVKNVPGSAESIIETISAHPSQKEHTLATGHSDGTVNIWDMRVDRKIMTHRRHENHVWKVDFSSTSTELCDQL
eukprot:TRINITY_DN10772_c0_g1_i2.p1 TRINITY_DN10772_c0_g1~~TRINITY_DN10772_c0_g1_i2.p1  ORF type:complete len:262 (+),score=39.39 TRINITY_DN10772_c0_g1_i2:52-837(+)